MKSFAVLAAVAALFAVGGRSGTLRGLGGPGRDERWAMIDLRATAFSGVVILLVLGGAWLTELGRGDDGFPADADLDAAWQRGLDALSP